MSIKFPKFLTKPAAILLTVILLMSSISLIFGLAAENDATVNEPIISLDFDCYSVTTNKNIAAAEGTSLPASPENGQIRTIYASSSKTSSGDTWTYSSWTLITSDANPKVTDKTYNWEANNEYMKMTYIYDMASMRGIDNNCGSNNNYLKEKKPSYYKDYAFNPFVGLPAYNSATGKTALWAGEAGKEYTLKIDIALVEDDDKKVEFYLTNNSGAANNETTSKNATKYAPSVEKGDVLIASTVADGDKKLNTQSLSNYTFQTFEVTFTAEAGKSPVIMMVTNDMQTIDAPANYSTFARAHIDNIAVYQAPAEYLDVATPDGAILKVKYTKGQKLSEIVPELAGYVNDGKWYANFGCTEACTDEYPVAGKTYFRAWAKGFTLDFEQDYILNGKKMFRNPLTDASWGEWYASANLNVRNQRDNNWELLMSYMNENPNCTSTTFKGANYANNPYIDLYDISTGNTFVGTNGFDYEISFDYEVAGPIPAEVSEIRLYLVKGTESTNSNDYAKLNDDYILVDKFDVIMTDGAKGTTPKLSFTAKGGYRPQIIMVTNGGTKVTPNPAEYHKVYIDNVKISEVFVPGRELVKVTFDANGGSAVDSITLIKGDAIGTVTLPTKSGSLFDGWYVGDKEVGVTYVPEADVTLKANWATATAKDYDNSDLNEGYGESYPNVLESYEDYDAATLLETGTANSKSTAANRWVKSGTPVNFGSALLLSNAPAAMSNAKEGIAATALLNKDGSKFTVKSGKIYKLEFDYLPVEGSAAHDYIRLVYGSYSADAIDASAAKGAEKIPVHGVNNKKQTVSLYFKAEQDGFVFFTLGSRQNFNSAPTEHYVLLDNIKITVTSGTKSITYKDVDTGKVVDSRPIGFNYHTQYGMPGDKIRVFGINSQAGKDIQGFYNDQACTQPCTDYDIIGEESRTVWVKMKDVSYDTVSDFTNPIELDFETSSDFDLDIKYRYMPYGNWQSSEADNGTRYIGNDAENAFAGTGYMRIYDYPHLYGDTSYSFMLYDKSNPSGMMILAPNTSYRITAMAKYEDDAKVPSLKIWTVDFSSYGYTRYKDATVTTTNDDLMGYTEISGVITTGDKAVGIAIGGVYLAEQNVYIDNVKVEVMTEKTITFETDGGDAIDPIVVLPYTELTSYDPGFAFKPGYEFIGWYLDKAFTKPFDFLADVITDNVTLYAKYVKEDLGEDEEITDTDTEIEEEEPISFGDKVVLGNADPIDRVITDAGLGIGWIIAIIAGVGILVLAGAAVLVIVLIKRKKR